MPPRSTVHHADPSQAADETMSLPGATLSMSTTPLTPIDAEEPAACADDVTDFSSATFAYDVSKTNIL